MGSHESILGGVLSRRRFWGQSSLALAGVSGLGLTLPEFLRGSVQASENVSSSTFGRAKRIIMVYLHGGHPQQETFDPKPQGPAAVRGEFQAIPTSVPGTMFSELLPGLASVAHQLAVVRSMAHTNPNHVTASLPAMTGHSHPAGTPETDFPPAATDFPPIGAVLSAVKPGAHQLPTWVRVGPLMRRNNGTVLHGQLPGFLGATHDHLTVDQSLLAEDVQIEMVRPSEQLTAHRVAGRQQLRQAFDEHVRVLDAVEEAHELDAFYQRAFALVTSSRTREAFNLSDEPPPLREHYGRTEFGQRCLLARRLVEAGVPMVNVSYCHTPSGSWDTHSNNFKQMRDSLAPTLDVAVSALINDLSARGLLAETLVVINAEFGRTPAINARAGRDHWPFVYSLALAGGGVAGGAVHGASDDSAAYPTESPCSPADFAATLYHLLGMPPETMVYDPSGRPHPLIIGRVIQEILV